MAKRSGLWTGCIITAISLVGIALLLGVGVGVFLWNAPPSVQISAPFTKANSLSHACNAGDGASCLDLALLFTAADELDALPSDTLDKLDRACKQDSPSLCAALAGIYTMESRYKDASRSRSAVTFGCLKREIKSCDILGMMAEAGLGGDKDLPLARGAYTIACEDARSTESCARLADIEAGGQGKAQDYFAASIHGGWACEADPVYCWNAAEYGELAAWQRCAPELGVADLSEVSVSRPLLLQRETSTATEYTTADSFETYVRTSGIIFQDSYLETRRIPGKTYTYTETTIDRYADAWTLVRNNSCRPVSVNSTLTFDFGVWDSLARGASAALFVYFVGAIAGADDEEVKEVALKAGAAGATSGLTGSARVDLDPNEWGTMVVEVDTRSLFGDDRKMDGVRFDALTVEFPEGDHCNPGCLVDLRDLSGEMQAIRARYARACTLPEYAKACDYLRGIDADNNVEAMTAACNQGVAPNFVGACRRLDYQDWL